MQTTNLRRFTEHHEPGDPYLLQEGHPAAVLGTSLYRQGRLRSSAWERGPILKSGHNSRKIGAVVQKGKWKGFPIYTLTLEERATCPRACLHWLDCYGNKMNWSTRWMNDNDLASSIERDLSSLAIDHENFVVRLHVLGDFFDLEYLRCWQRWLNEYGGLHVYGYTAWTRDTLLGAAIADFAAINWERFALRTSNAEGLRTTRSVDDATLAGRFAGGIVCPAQTGQTECCATCALCWQTEDQIVFLRH